MPIVEAVGGSISAMLYNGLESNIRCLGVLSMVLDKELATYHSKLPEWKGNEGKFVLIHGTDVIDTFSSYEDAIKEGYARFKLEPFLVKQIQTVEQAQSVTRLIAPNIPAA